MCFFGGLAKISDGVAPSPSLAGRGTYSFAFTTCSQKNDRLFEDAYPAPRAKSQVIKYVKQISSCHGTAAP